MSFLDVLFWLPRKIWEVRKFLHYIAFVGGLLFLFIGLIGFYVCDDPEGLSASIYGSSQEQIQEVGSIAVQGINEQTKGYAQAMIDFSVANVCPLISSLSGVFFECIKWGGIVAAVALVVILVWKGPLPI